MSKSLSSRKPIAARPTRTPQPAAFLRKGRRPSRRPRAAGALALLVIGASAAGWWWHHRAAGAPAASTAMALPPIEARLLAAAGIRFTDVAVAAGVRFEHTSGASGRLLLPETLG